MKQKHFFLLFLGILAAEVAAAQNGELHIPLESDNQFPPEEHAETVDIPIEGSGDGVVSEPADTTTETLLIPKIEDVKSPVLSDNETESSTFESSISPTSETADACPKPCVCNIEGATNNFIVDCSGYGLTEFPKVIDPRTTTLNLQNNKLTEIPKEISALKNLKVLNANNNQIMELAPGSVSELPELVTLKLANNRLIEYPRDLKNSLVLTKLEELDLGGNDMRTNLGAEVFLQFKALKKLTLATSTPELLDGLCAAYKETLETVCTGSCDTKTYDCPDTPQNIEEDLIEATLPGMIAFMGAIDGDPNIENPNNDANTTTTEKPTEVTVSPQTTGTSSVAESTTTTQKTQSAGEFSLRTAVNKEPAEHVVSNSIVEKPKEENKATTSPTEVKIGAKTEGTKTGGVDKSVIGIIVAGMIIVVAVVTIKKNWSSIRKRFGSSPRPPNNRTEATTNGTSPEEVPLQDKSPV
ncbi:PREDICTED: uncharacterized protein LOC106115859 [Papilio xuthus]|uniref:Podocan n=1 Tax=Papilio xuthus TaxID=66420 RepID=A0A194PRL5_PAPXU|nr:PREDICTED: uncharacterized protein LOC106115859 [Papilio xuthus]KPI95593.1 Podocan [Papilio xuthus]